MKNAKPASAIGTPSSSNSLINTEECAIAYRCAIVYGPPKLIGPSSGGGPGKPVKPYRGPGAQAYNLQGGPPNKYFKPVLLLITVSDCVDTITHLKLRQSGRSLNFVYQRLSYNKAITNICRYTISGYWLPPTSTVIYNAVNKTCQLQLALPY